MIKLGDVEIHRIVEHDIPVYAPTDMFDEATPEALQPYLDWLVPRAICPDSGCLVMPVLSYLVRTRHHNILMDTCCGHEKTYAEPRAWHQPSNAAWLQRLHATGITPEQIDYVFCTHLHSDHVGWNTRLIDGRWVPTFPNATYVFARDEVNVTEAEERLIYSENVLPIIEAKQALLVDTDYALDDQVWLEPTIGHTAGHVAIHFKSGPDRAVMCGDLIHSPLQLAEPDWSCNSDFDLELSVATRRAFLDKYCDTESLVMTAHFPLPSVGRIIAGRFLYDFEYL